MDYRDLPLPPCPRALELLAADRLTAFVRVVYGLSRAEAAGLLPWQAALLADAALMAEQRHDNEAP